MLKVWVLDTDSQEWINTKDLARVHVLALREFERANHAHLRGMNSDKRLDMYLTMGSPGDKPVVAAKPAPMIVTEQDSQADGYKAPTDLCLVCGLRVPRSEADAGEVCRCKDS